MTEIERTDLARERTHAAWLRTCLSFVVALAALSHYALPDPSIAASLLAIFLVFGSVGAAKRAATVAPDLSTKLYSYALVFAPSAVIMAFG